MRDKQDYTLRLLFDSEKAEQLYQGDSWFNQKIIDHLEIKESEITIRFTRLRKTHPEEYVLSENSTVRLQLYRAACYYLAVTGELPGVKAILLSSGSQEIALDKDDLTQNWKNCRAEVLLDKDVAARCFGEHGKRVYIALTYFLKAQLDTFSHDAFRAAWSGLNAIYQDLSENQRESDKLSMLRKVILDRKSPNAEAYTKTLSEPFWKHIQWHNYVQWKGIDKIEDDIMHNRYADAVIYQKLAGYVRRAYEKDQPERADEISRYAEARMKKKMVNANERVRFLITEYCYMLRNRSFHATKPYPIFGMNNSPEEDTEKNLIVLMLLTIKDLMNHQVI